MFQRLEVVHECLSVGQLVRLQHCRKLQVMLLRQEPQDKTYRLQPLDSICGLRTVTRPSTTLCLRLHLKDLLVAREASKMGTSILAH